MIRACKRCHPAVIPGVTETVIAEVGAGGRVTEVVSLCMNCRQQAVRESDAGRKRWCKALDIAELYDLWTLPTVPEPVR